MSDIVVRAEGLGKKYLIGHRAERERYTALRDVIGNSVKAYAQSASAMVARREPLASNRIEEFWALKDVNFEIKRGDVVGIIGRNGAGKSTLLKILSRITEPSQGRVEITGRVASLLEVGTGFHPELTGRENIYLNGAILGLSRAEIHKSFDEIVAFAEVERFLDTPVKRYSSGMSVRLAFAVAAHLEPEILVVDEVLAVGDAAFQKKCLGKMQNVANGGRTILLVSHNIGSLDNICSTGLLLEAGRLRKQDEIQAVLKLYRTGSPRIAPSANHLCFGGPLRSVKIDGLRLNTQPLAGHAIVSSEAELSIELAGSASEPVAGFRFAFALYHLGTRIVTFHDGPADLPAGTFTVRVTIPARLLRPGEYTVGAGGRKVAGDEWCWAQDIATIEITPMWGPSYDPDDNGIFNLPGRIVRITTAPAATAQL